MNLETGRGLQIQFFPFFPSLGSVTRRNRVYIFEDESKYSNKFSAAPLDFILCEERSFQEESGSKLVYVYCI